MSYCSINKLTQNWDSFPNGTSSGRSEKTKNEKNSSHRSDPIKSKSASPIKFQNCLLSNRFYSSISAASNICNCLFLYHFYAFFMNSFVFCLELNKQNAFDISVTKYVQFNSNVFWYFVRKFG